MSKKIICVIFLLVINCVGIGKSFSVTAPNPGRCYHASGDTVKELNVPVDIISDASVGSIATSVSASYVGVNATCSGANYLAAGDGSTYRSYVTKLTTLSTEGSYKYLQINDYLAVAVSISDDHSGRFYPPANMVHMGWHGNVKVGQEFPVADSNLIYKFKVLKSFTGTLTIPNTTLFDVYVGADIGTYGSPVMENIVYSIVIPGVTISVPQTCTVNAGSVIDFDFSDINATSFSRAGAGVKPTDVATQSKSFNIACSDSDANSSLKLTLQTPNASGNIILSSNSDLGFIITNDSDKIIIPNDTTSTINTVLDSTSQANVTIKAYPVSVTGKKPAEGYFSATAYLIVDYA
ncbi:fimbrial protein [Pantoea agglomerans]|uniref:fimbrial protein n=1 Tax=Enterobacter agglomerans TaxID=549 RepID=UPI0010C20BBC|nr:fimbrial protein [Pantoea agglomerans]MBD8183708.1 fimbrial protein [Pantoea agglomerans]MBD8223310.1 fimbrial protein [Pantoea agglomerans]TKJ55022.1 adhesin [Pantoea agglomerans]TKK15626.1 adhesin [Pantoea agglomerans]TKK30278.1 adhesin [Pantoea agglomerans]